MISLCLSMFNWVKFGTANGGLKTHTFWDDQLCLPDLINITEVTLYDSKALNSHVFKKGTIIVGRQGLF